MKLKKTNFEENSYQKHEDHYLEYYTSDSKRARALSWKRTDTVDAWCRQRLISSIDPVLQEYSSADWLTVGDGRYGSDAHYIESKGGNALATDISDLLLKEALAEGYIRRAQRENAESLSFEDGQFDFVLCKDSLHHFPRPTLALHEMLRVARKGVILIEPMDDLSEASIPQTAYRLIKESIFFIFLRRKPLRFQYEEVGNFIYSVSRREIEKTAVALNYPYVVFKGLNTYYIEGAEDEILSAKGPLFRRITFMLGWRNLLNWLGLKPPGVLVSMIFKVPLSQDLQKALVRLGYEVRVLPSNPVLVDED